MVAEELLRPEPLCSPAGREGLFLYVQHMHTLGSFRERSISVANIPAVFVARQTIHLFIENSPELGALARGPKLKQRRGTR